MKNRGIVTMKIPERLKPLLEEGLIDEVIYQLMSGKEAAIYMVRCGEAMRCAKVYKDNRKFKHYRRYRETEHFDCSTPATSKPENEASMLCRLAMAGVAVPKFYNLFADVLLMELITDAQHHVASRLSNVTLTAKQARRYHQLLIDHIVRMLDAGIVHGDLSPYNVLIGKQGPVVIDWSQAVSADGDYHTRHLIKRDVDHLTAYFSRFAPELMRSDYAAKIWCYCQHGTLHPPMREFPDVMLVQNQLNYLFPGLH